MRIALIRHTAPLIAPGTCYGRLDIPVAPDAEADIAGMIPGLHGTSRVWSSPARRCRGLAEAIAAALAVPLHTDPRLQELDFGAWEGSAWDAIERTALDRWAASPLTFAPPGGETGTALIDRIRAFHEDLQRDAQDCVIVSHGGPLKVLSALLLGRLVDLLAPAPKLGSIMIIDRRTV
jgi:alpha-ribazole phosphatase